jgi:hypothetical protein
LLQEVGNAVSHLNTLVVGLDAVEKGHKKPDTLDISWNPDDPIAAARQSRKFVVEAVFVRVSEAVIEYILALVRLPRLRTVSAGWDGGTTNAQKVSDVLSELLKNDYRISAVVLLVHWRNRIVHRGSNSKLTQEQKFALQANEEKIANDYKRLSVDCLLCHFEERRPTLKDISSLISICLNVAWEVNESMHDSLSREDLDAWLIHYSLGSKIERIKRETRPEKLQSSIHRLFLSEAPRLYDAYQKFEMNDPDIGKPSKL